MSMRKATYIKGMAEACAKGDLDLDGLKLLPDQEVVARLSALRGIGAWTAEMILIFSLQRPDVVSWNDLAIRRGMMILYGLDQLTRDRFDQHRKRYSPYGSVASLYLWEISHEPTE
jgi:DNA-3-methyladenine glycosylase II